jgi:hypothetical protein
MIPKAGFDPERHWMTGWGVFERSLDAAKPPVNRLACWCIKRLIQAEFAVIVLASFTVTKRIV